MGDSQHMQENTSEQAIDQMAAEDPRELVIQLAWMRRELAHTQDRSTRMKSLLERKSAAKLKPAKKARLVRRFTVADAYAKQVAHVADQVELKLSQLNPATTD